MIGASSGCSRTSLRTCRRDIRPRLSASSTACRTMVGSAVALTSTKVRPSFVTGTLSRISRSLGSSGAR